LLLLLLLLDESLEGVMQAHLAASTRALLPDDGGPVWELTAPESAIEQARRASIAAQHNTRPITRHRATVWSLVDALWGQPLVDAAAHSPAVTIDCVVENNKNSFFFSKKQARAKEQRRRKLRFDSWLRQQARLDVNVDDKEDDKLDKTYEMSFFID
jgi:hypothetical protein